MVRHRTPPICISARTGSRRHRGFTQLDPTKKGIIETLKFRFHTGIWSYTAGNINYQY